VALLAIIEAKVFAQPQTELRNAASRLLPRPIVNGRQKQESFATCREVVRGLKAAPLSRAPRYRQAGKRQGSIPAYQGLRKPYWWVVRDQDLYPWSPLQ
jgi:hypothetical protein